MQRIKRVRIRVANMGNLEGMCENDVCAMQIKKSTCFFHEKSISNITSLLRSINFPNGSALMFLQVENYFLDEEHFF